MSGVAYRRALERGGGGIARAGRLDSQRGTRVQSLGHHPATPAAASTSPTPTRVGSIWRLTSANRNPAAPFATGVPGTNGLAFDRDGNLWTGDGTTGQGRVWRIKPDGGVSEVFRVQPMRNSTALGGTIAGDGIGRQARSFPPGTLTVTVPASATSTVITPAGGQDLVANGVAFNHQGNLFVADTARGAIWRAQFDRNGNLTSRTGCDTTFTADTLCLENIFVEHAALEGTDGIALDSRGQHLERRQRAKRDRRRHQGPRRRRDLQEPAERRRPAELRRSWFRRRPHSGAADEPGAVPEGDVRGQLGRQPPRQLAQQRRRDQFGWPGWRSREDQLHGSAAADSGHGIAGALTLPMCVPERRSVMPGIRSG